MGRTDCRHQCGTDAGSASFDLRRCDGEWRGIHPGGRAARVGGLDAQIVWRIARHITAYPSCGGGSDVGDRRSIGRERSGCRHLDQETLGVLPRPDSQSFLL